MTSECMLELEGLAVIVQDLTVVIAGDDVFRVGREGRAQQLICVV